MDDEADENKIEEMRGSPTMIGNLEEFIDENHAIVSSNMGSEYYTGILSIVDKEQLEPNTTVMLNNRSMTVVGIL